MTNAQFVVFLNEQGNQAEGGVTWLDMDSEDSGSLIEEAGGKFQPKAGYGQHPVVKVTWYGAKSYCEGAGGSLPTEEE